MKTSSSLRKGISLGLILFALGSSSALRAQDLDGGATLTLNGGDFDSGTVVTVAGTGNLTVTGVNAYTGGTIVSNGTLVLSGPLVTTTGILTLSIPPGTGTGTGTLQQSGGTGSISVSAGEILELLEGPKDSDPAMDSTYPTSVIDDLKYGSSNTIPGFEIYDSALGDGDVTITTASNYTGTTETFTGGLTITDGGTLTLTGVSTGTLSVNGTDDPADAPLSQNGNTYISLRSNPAAEGVITVAVPEPSTWLMLAGGFSLLFLGRRFRKFSR